MESRRRHGATKRRAVRRLICRDTLTDLDCESALAIIEPYFIAIQERFVDYEVAVLPEARMKRVRLECSGLMHDSPRHFAAAAETGQLIVVAPHLAELPEETVLAIVAHEFGHAMDFSYPALYSLSDDGRLLARPEASIGDVEPNQRTDQARVARMRQWRDRDEHAVEVTADKIAEEVMGRSIGYAGPCELQAFDRGVPRQRSIR
jgi:hypothetical protein